MSKENNLEDYRIKKLKLINNFLHKIEPNKNLITNHYYNNPNIINYNNPNIINIPNSHIDINKVYGKKVLNNKDVIDIIKKYNSNKEVIGIKFSYKNLNSGAINIYNDICWNKGWVNYRMLFNKNVFFLPDIQQFPQIYKICFKTVLDFVIYLKEFHLGKHKINDIFISKDKKIIKFETIVSVTKNIHSMYFVIKLNTYYNKYDNTIRFGKADYLGMGTTGDILVPTGNDKLINEKIGKSLNELHDYDLINYRKATDMYWRHIYYYK